MIYLVIYLVRGLDPRRDHPQRGRRLGLSRLAHEEAHPVVPNPR